MFTGLSLDQAPPFEAPLRFFITAPIFAIFGGLAIFFSDDISNIYAPQTIAVIHLFTLGFMSMIMIGAMQQMLPVLVGVRFPKPLLFSKIIHLFLVLGSILFFAGFFYDLPNLLIFSSISLFLSIAVFIIITLYKLFSASFGSATVLAMRFALISFLIAFLVGSHLLFSIGSSKIGENFYNLLNLHAIWAFFGWVGLLIIGVSYQVIPMFYVTPDFQKKIKSYLSLSIFLFLLLSSFSIFIDFEYTLVFLLFAFSIFGYFSLELFKKRKRKLTDITINYWKVSSISLIVGSLFLAINLFLKNETLFFISGVILGYGFAISLINGMLYKIIPFLAWFHLSSKGFFDIPTMKEMIKDKDAKLQLIFHLVAFISLLFIPILPIQKISAIFIGVSNILLLINLFKAIKIYNDYKKRPNPMESFNLGTKKL